jgi:hypothetical protein
MGVFSRRADVKKRRMHLTPSKRIKVDVLEAEWKSGGHKKIENTPFFHSFNQRFWCFFLFLHPTKAVKQKQKYVPK